MRPPITPENVSVAHRGFHQHDGDASFNATLGQDGAPRALDASFISAYDRASLSNLGIPLQAQPRRARRARDSAVKQGLGVRAVGFDLARAGTGYEITVKAAQPVTGEVITSESSVGAEP
jgi:hypothetical protein